MSLSARNLSVQYNTASRERILALDALNLSIADGEFVTIIGPSGCGKSTLLHCLGGLLRPTGGTVEVDGQEIKDPDPELAAFVFQDYSLLPWKSVSDNVAIGLRWAGVDKAKCRETALAMLDLVGLREFADGYPQELSGGMKQRVAIARALAVNPRILLMDEPFGALDEQSRRHLGFEMAGMLTERKASVVLVTHSLDEAILWADRIIVLSARPGRIVKEVIISDPRPRGIEFMGTPLFAEARRELLSLLEPTLGAPGPGVSATSGVNG